MTKFRSVSILAAALVMWGATSAYAGLFSSVRDHLSSGVPSHEAGEQVGASPQATPPPAEQANTTKSNTQPTKEDVQADEKKLKRELNWEKPPADLFQRYAGVWDGNYWVYSTQGRKEQISKVRIKFEPVSSNTMKATTVSYDQVSRQFLPAESSIYRIQGDTITVETTEQGGKVSRQAGHFQDGYIFSESKIKDGVEHFREKVDGKRLLIDGFGVYDSKTGKDQHVFIGRLLKTD